MLKELEPDHFVTHVKSNQGEKQSLGAEVIAKGVVQFFLLALVLYAGYFGMNYLISQREDPVSRPPFQRVYTVDTVVAERGNFQPNFLVYGEVQASRSIELRSLVAGQVVEVNPNVKVGARVDRGDELFRIDAFQFEKELASAIANINETSAKIEENKARIAIEQSRIRSLREQLELARRDLERISSLRDNGTATAKQVEDRSLVVSQRTQSLEQSELNLVAEQSRLQQLEAVNERFDWTKKQAERNLSDTVLKAPASGVISQKNIAVGRLINANDVVVSMYEDNQLEVRFTLTDQRFGRIQSDDVGIVGRKVDVIWSVGGEETTYKAKIDRISAQIASNRGGVEVIATLENVTGSSVLRPGAFVEIIVPDRNFKDHFKMLPSDFERGKVG